MGWRWAYCHCNCRRRNPYRVYWGLQPLRILKDRDSNGVMCVTRGRRGELTARIVMWVAVRAGLARKKREKASSG